MIPAKDIIAHEQTWYGEYSVPTDAYVVAKDTKIHEAGLLGRLNENHPIFLRDGYIIVNFNIETIRNGDVAHPYLQYIHAKYMNQWFDMEGFARSVTDPYGHVFHLQDGDVMFYHGDASSKDDFTSSVTH